MIRPVLAAMCALLCLLFAATASAYDMRRSNRLTVDTLGAIAPAPLTGEGENLELVANLPIDPGSFGVAVSDLELFGNYAFLGSYGEGLVIVDISDPRNPRRVGKFNCPGGQNDVQLSPDGHYAAMAIETRSNKCHPNDEGTVILDVQDRANPVELAFIDKTKLPNGSHNDTLDWPYLYVDQYVNTYSKLEIFDLSNPTKPTKVGGIDYGGQDSHHDLIVDHRADGKSFAYAASINFTDVIDVTDPAKPVLRERIKDPQVTISHQAEPNFDRSLLLVTDEHGGGSAGGGCGGNPAATVPQTAGGPPQISDPASIGALHLYKLNPDGSIAGPNGVQKQGIFNIPYQASDPEAGCTIHVFWQAPDQNRLVTAWYGRGTRVVDFSNPKAPKQLAWFVPTNADTWSAKPHNGYIYSGDIRRGLDVFRYTGENGDGWPATAGPAEVQRAKQQGASTAGSASGSGSGAGNATPPAQTSADGRAQGRRSLRIKVRVPDRRRSKRAALVVSFKDRAGRLVTRVRTRVRDNGKRTLRASVAGLAGRYRYSVRLGDRGKILKRGSFAVKRQPGAQTGIRSDQALICQIR